jgi:hypothetical protein
MVIMPVYIIKNKGGSMGNLHEQLAPKTGNPNELETTILNEHDLEVGVGSIAIDGTGKINITNTGGSSASEGGMGTGGGPEKGAGIESPTGDKANASTKESDDGAWDPLKPKEEKEKDNS